MSIQAPRMKPNWVYIMTNKRNGTLYTGSTSNIVSRIFQHREGQAAGFTKRYSLTRLVWYEEFPDYDSAISMEHRLKRWRRAWKIELIEKDNPDWKDLWTEIAGLH